ncbi:hypothetical protein EON64_03610 [archaeon]|nr:MAG: hypothetical protein EON64_03610 [archaeon]
MGEIVASVSFITPCSKTVSTIFHLQIDCSAVFQALPQHRNQRVYAFLLPYLVDSLTPYHPHISNLSFLQHHCAAEDEAGDELYGQKGYTEVEITLRECWM